MICSSIFHEWTLNIFLKQTIGTRHVTLDPLQSDPWSILFLEFLTAECHETDRYIHERLKRCSTIISNLYGRFSSRSEFRFKNSFFLDWRLQALRRGRKGGYLWKQKVVSLISVERNKHSQCSQRRGRDNWSSHLGKERNV